MSLDSGNRLITLTVVAVCVVVLAVQVVVCRPPMTWIPLLTAALLVPIMGSCWAMPMSGTTGAKTGMITFIPPTPTPLRAPALPRASRRSPRAARG